MRALGSALPGQEHHLLEKGFIALRLRGRRFPRRGWNVREASTLVSLRVGSEILIKQPCTSVSCKKEGDEKLAANGNTF